LSFSTPKATFSSIEGLFSDDGRKIVVQRRDEVPFRVGAFITGRTVGCLLLSIEGVK
jgi:hypothetical protein